MQIKNNKTKNVQQENYLKNDRHNLTEQNIK